ncbi:alpha/beta fold hydrolase [Rubrobacter marinus]|nr:alpha/beta fold hydrolase [Rubrobacter marinus]
MRTRAFRTPRRFALAGLLSTGLLSAPVLLGLAGSVAFYLRPMATFRALSRAGLRLSGASERTAEVHGLPVRYFEASPKSSPAGGEAIVLLHGLNDSAETWARVMPALARDRRVLAPDLAGFGRVPVPREGMRLSALVRYLAGFLDAVGVERAVLVGNSLGGAVAIRYAVENPGRVSRLFLLDSAGLLTEAPPELEPETREEARELVGMTFGPEVTAPRFVLDGLIRWGRNPAHRAYIHSDEPTDVGEDLSRIEAPTTIIWGEQDRLIPPDHGAEMHAAIPNSELILLPGVAHVPQAQAPREVLRIVAERLAPDGTRA